jgi:hypothetical protein
MDSNRALSIAQQLALSDLHHEQFATILSDVLQRSSSRHKLSIQAHTLSQASFIQYLSRCCEDFSDEMLYLVATEQAGVAALSIEAEAELKALHDFVVAANGGSSLFTVPYLAALGEELGFAASEERARYFLTDTHAVRSKQVAVDPSDWVIADATPYDKITANRAAALPTLPPDAAGASGTPAVLLVRSHVAVPVRADEWVNFMADVMRGCSTEEISSACEVFIYLQSARPQ